MKRRDALKAMAGLTATSVLGGVPRAEQDQGDEMPLPVAYRKIYPRFEKLPIKVSRLATGLSLIAGPGGNVTALVGPDGLLLVDAFLPSRSADLIRVVREMGAGPITLINTHWHFDHTGGNAALAAAGAKIIAHENTRTRLRSEQYVVDLQMRFPPPPAAALPVMTLGDSATFFLNGEEIHATHAPSAHTDGDVFIHYRKANVLQAGDLFFNGAYPNIEGSSGGWIGGMIAASDALLEVADAGTRIIPGHGAPGTRDDLKAFRGMLAEARDRIEPLVRAGKTVDEAVAARPLASLDARWGKGSFKGSHFTRLVYNGLAKRCGKESS
jgi:glyoxylase-like metal-dependent hydrolase (beta-lactamase superfamily II)